REGLFGGRRDKWAPTVPYGARPRGGATLHWEGGPLVLRKPPYLKNLPDELRLSLVRVYEPEPPLGEEPVEWWLVTSEPVTSQEQVEAVVDWYRVRWKIEEDFK